MSATDTSALVKCAQCDQPMDPLLMHHKCDGCGVHAHRMCCYGPNYGDMPLPNYCKSCWKKIEMMPGANKRSMNTKEYCVSCNPVLALWK